MYRGTRLNILDNSGATSCEIIRVLRSKYEHPYLALP